MYCRLISISVLICSGLIEAGEPDECGVPFIPADSSYQFKEIEHGSPPANARFGKIQITRLPIFDEANPQENNRLYRFANRFHILTTKANIEQQLLFAEGDPFSLQLIDESARLLRKLDHLYDATVRTVGTVAS